ncbi:MAG: ABC transporter ATP-binding protein [Solirubrobacterales bacterium]|nr:ABC transporter ATP-binding protein [Solirubrobacterales bacterium]OJU93202.1 MAG: ABC transporter [Solirubrobacterales bacterium 67-14]
MPTFRRLLGFLRPHRRELWGSMIFAWAAMGMTVLIPWLVGQAVNAVQDSDESQLFWFAGAILVAAILRLVLTVIRRVIAGKVSLAVEFDLRQEVYAHLMRLELGFFDRNQTGQLMSRATVDLQAIRFFLGYGLIFFSQSLLTVALAGVVMLAINPWLALFALAPAPLIVFTALRYTRQSRPAMQEVQQRVAELTAQAEESVSGIRVVKAFAREDHQFERFQGAVDRLFDQSIRTTRIQAFFTPLIGALPQLGTALVLLIGGHAVLNGNLDLGQFTAFYTYMLMLAGPLRTVGMALGMGQRAIAAGNRLFEVLDREPELFSKPDAEPLPEGGGAVTFDSVSLSYGPEAPEALDEINLDVPAGSRIALVGPSGSGKTSLAALLARLYDPTEGSVSIDGADLREVDLPSLRHEIAYVSDDNFLFSDTIAENISYARPDATRDEVERAARLAQAAEFIEALPDGYETVVGERGLTLSGGQRQRVAIARALLADPRILILDDATSSLDATTEQQIRSGLAEVMAGRTTFVIGHRLSTVSLADEVVLMDQGRIRDRGTIAELTERSPLFRELTGGSGDDPLFVPEDEEVLA